MRFTVQPNADPVKLAAKTVAGLAKGDVVWERRRASMPVIVEALRRVRDARPDVRASKLEAAGEVLVCLSVSPGEWSGVGYATGRKVPGEGD